MDTADWGEHVGSDTPRSPSLVTTVSIGHKDKRFEGLEADGGMVISTGEGRREEVLRRNPQTSGDPFTSRGSDNILAPDSSKHEADKGRLQNTWSVPS